MLKQKHSDLLDFLNLFILLIYFVSSSINVVRSVLTM